MLMIEIYDVITYIFLQSVHVTLLIFDYFDFDYLLVIIFIFIDFLEGKIIIHTLTNN